MSSRDLPDLPVPRIWRARHLDPDTLTFSLGGQAVFIGVLTALNPFYFTVLGSRVGLEFTPYLFAFGCVLLGLAMLFLRRSKVKRGVLLFGVLVWVYLAASFIIVSPLLPLTATAFAGWTAVISVIAYVRSWVWVIA
jgi:FtsH-binding integral membrane protein